MFGDVQHVTQLEPQAGRPSRPELVVRLKRRGRRAALPRDGLDAMIPPTAFGQHFAFQMAVALGAGLLGLMAMYFARRYLLTRTRWRGFWARATWSCWPSGR